MFRHRVRPPSPPLDEITAERLLRGDPIDDLPDAFRPLGQLLADANAAGQRRGAARLGCCCRGVRRRAPRRQRTASTDAHHDRVGAHRARPGCHHRHRGRRHAGFAPRTGATGRARGAGGGRHLGAGHRPQRRHRDRRWRRTGVGGQRDERDDRDDGPGDHAEVDRCRRRAGDSEWRHHELRPRDRFRERGRQRQRHAAGWRRRREREPQRRRGQQLGQRQPRPRRWEQRR